MAAFATVVPLDCGSRAIARHLPIAVRGVAPYDDDIISVHIFIPS